jgi:Fic family protein
MEMKKIEKAPATVGFVSQNMIELVNHPEMLELMSKISEEYYYWDKVKHQPLPAGVQAMDVWALVKTRRRITPYRIKFGGYSFLWNSNNRIQEALHFFDMNIGGSMASATIISKEDRNRYMISSIMEEAIASSQIEGAVTTRRVAKEMLRKRRAPANKDEQMILNNYLTIQKILEIKDQPLGMANLLAIHQLVSSNTFHNKAEEGALRVDNEINVVDNATGAIVHEPPKHEELPALLEDLFRFFNEDDPRLFIHPLIKACIIHFMIGFIHPFADGNGRTARALFYWYLLRKGYWLTEHLSISRLILKAKAQYALAYQYTEIDEHDLTYFILFKLRVMKAAFEELRLYIQRKQDEKRKATSFLEIEGINYREAVILEWFDKEPSLLLTIKEAQTRLGMSHQSARLSLAHLVDLGYLDDQPLDGKTKAFKRSVKYDTLLK